MNQPPARPIDIYTKDDVVHIRVDAPGERAVSAPVYDALALIREVANQAGFEVDDSVPGELYVSWPV